MRWGGCEWWRGGEERGRAAEGQAVCFRRLLSPFSTSGVSLTPTKPASGVCVEQISCQSESILLGRALVACVVGVGRGACCSTWALPSTALSVSTRAARCCRSRLLDFLYPSTMFL